MLLWQTAAAKVCWTAVCVGVLLEFITLGRLELQAEAVAWDAAKGRCKWRMKSFTLRGLLVYIFALLATSV